MLKLKKKKDCSIEQTLIYQIVLIYCLSVQTNKTYIRKNDSLQEVFRQLLWGVYTSKFNSN